MRILLIIVSSLLLLVQAQSGNNEIEQQREKTLQDTFPAETNTNISAKQLTDQFLIITSLPDRLYSYTPSCLCGKPNINNLNVLNRFPWAVQLLTTITISSSTLRYLCGAALINNQYVLTAATCVRGINTLIYARILRKHSPMLGGWQRKIDNINYHPDFNPSTFKANFALLKLAQTISLQQPGISPICLPNFNTVNVFAGRTAYYGSWSRNTNTGIYNSLSVRMVNTLPNLFCQQLRQNNNILDDMGCSSPFTSGSTVDCTNERGGPLSIFNANTTFANRHQLFGVGSFGFACPLQTTLPLVYTYIPPYVNYIYNITKGSLYCQREV